MEFEKILVVDKNGKQNEWIIENDYKDTYTIFRLGTIRTLNKNKCSVIHGKLYSYEIADVITRKDEDFKECIEKCHMCEREIYNKNQLRVTENDDYICGRCARKYNINVKPVGDVVLDRVKIK